MTRQRLTLFLLLFFTALALPTSILVYQAYGQLKWEAFYQHQRLARELNLRVDAGFRDLIEREEARPISDYDFLNVSGSGQSAFLQRSPLSRFPLQSDLPGLLGYFQVDASGQLRTPILPQSNTETYGIEADELLQRQQLAGRIRSILGENRLVGKAEDAVLSRVGDAPISDDAASDMAVMESAESAAAAGLYEATPEAEISGADGAQNIAIGKIAESAQSGFDILSSRRLRSDSDSGKDREQVRDLQLEDSFQVAAEPEKQVVAEESRVRAETKQLRKETVNLPQTRQAPVAADSAMGSDQLDEAPLQPAAAASLSQQAIRIETFESEVEPMEFALLDSGHFVLFRRVWHRDQRQVQGVLLEQSDFIEELVAPAFRESTLSSMSELIVAYRGAILQQYAPDYDRRYQPGSSQVSSELLYQGRLIAPFSDLELIYTLARLPLGAGAQVVIWSAIVLVVVLIGGCLMLLRLGQRQLALARQQQDFVSAVSHELKTPLTSIRMYGEMLREGWADEARRKTYYDFIFHESERLTRLINNVLQLARMSRNEQAASRVTVSVADALAELEPRLQSQLEASAFALEIDADATARAANIRIDRDWFIQIFINLVDNAVKFSAAADQRRVDIQCRLQQDGRVQFSVRDYGPGIEAGQMKKIFTLFYRAENELTRETVGTGIGLALVQQLASAMQAEVDVVNCSPGAEFRIRFASDS